MQGRHLKDRLPDARPERFAWENHHDLYLKGVLGWDRGFAVPRSRLIALHWQAQRRGTALNLPPGGSLAVPTDALGPPVAPPGAAQLTWLHIADLKMKDEDARDQVHTALINWLRHWASHGRRADFLFIAGDIAASGQPAEYSRAKTYLRELCEAGQIPIENVIMVPGNHDVDRKTLPGLERTLETIQDVEKYFQPNPSRSHLVKFEAFIKFHNDFYGTNISSASMRKTAEGMATSSATILTAAGLRIGILPINTAWFSAGKDDSGKLLVGEAVLRLELARIQDATIRIALMHHPISDLSTLERSLIQQRLHGSCHFVLHGRRHGATASVAATGDPKTIVFGSGTSVVHEEHRRDCALFVTLTVPPGAATAEVRPFPLRYERTAPDYWTLDSSVFPKNYPTHLHVLQIDLQDKDRR